MGETKQEQTTTIPGRGGQESELLTLLTRLAGRAGGQLGDLSALARGEVGLPSGTDRELIARSIGYTRDIAQREAESVGGEMRARLGEQLAGLGIQGSSAEAVQRAILERDLQRSVQNSLSQAQMAGGEALMNLPFQRAQTQLSANQLLFQQIMGAGGTSLAHMLQERMAQPTTTTTVSDPSQYYNMAKEIGAMAAAPFTGGASLALLGMPTGGGGGGSAAAGAGAAQAANNLGAMTYPKFW